MPMLITMRGLLEPVKIEEGFHEFANGLNLAAAKGHAIILCRTPDGENILVATQEILTAKEVDD